MTTYDWTPGANGLWSDPNNWSPTGVPGSADTADAVLGAAVINSSTSVGSVFLGGEFPNIHGGTLFDVMAITVNSGVSFAVDGPSSITQESSITVQTGGTLELAFNGIFSNDGTVTVGENVTQGGGTASLVIDGSVMLGGVTLGGPGPQNYSSGASTGSIVNAPSTANTLINESLISGGGSISVSTFVNYGGVEASQPDGFALQINSPSFTNYGSVGAETGATLDLGQDGVAGSLDDFNSQFSGSGTIFVDNGGRLAIRGNLSIIGGVVTGGGGEFRSPIEMGGAGSAITSDGAAASTFVNDGNLIEEAAQTFNGSTPGNGQIGDAGVLGGAVNDLTFDNDGGVVLVDGSGYSLTLNTGGNAITDNDGGLFLAENAGQMLIDSNVDTGGGAPGDDGMIEATSGATITISAAIAPGGADPADGSIVIDGGTVIMASSATDTVPIIFAGPGSVLQLDSAANTVGAFDHMNEGDSIDVGYVAFSAANQLVWQQNGGSGTMSLVSSGGMTLASFTLSGTYTAADFTTAADGSGGTLIEGLDMPLAPGTTDVMLVQQASSGDVEIFDIADNAFAAANQIAQISPLESYGLGQFGLDLQTVDVGSFNGSDSADMLMRDVYSNDFWMLDVSGNSVTKETDMGNIFSSWKVLGFGDFSGNAGETDMLMQDTDITNFGAIELYDISGGQFSGSFSMGSIGASWQLLGFGDFSGHAGETDMLMRDTGLTDGHTGALELYDIADNSYTGFFSLGSIGLSWQVLGFGDFSGHAGESDMLMRNIGTGNIELYDITNNGITGFFSMGAIGTSWQVVGFGDFSGNAGEDDMLMRNSGTGAFELYDINNNGYTGEYALGGVGTSWQVVGLGDFSGNPNEDDMLMRNSGTGAFEVYDITDNAITNAAAMGGVGTDWTVAGIADPPGSSGAMSSQLVQAMASYAPNNAAAVSSPAAPVTPAQSMAPNMLATTTSPNP